MNRIKLGWAAAFIFLMQTAGSVSAEKKPSPLVDVSGTKISIVQPVGFIKAERFSGFQQEASNSSVMVMEMSAPFDGVTAGFTKERLAQQNMELIEKKKQKIAGYDGYLLNIKQEAYGHVFLKWIAVFGDANETVLVTAVFPEHDKKQLSEMLKNTVLGAEWDRKKIIDPFADVNFTIKPPDTMAFAFKLSKLITFSQDGSRVQKDPNKPMFMVGPSESIPPSVVHKEVAETHLRGLKPYKVSKVVKSAKTTIDGLPGWEMEAEVQHAASGTPMQIYQTLLFEKKYFYIVLGSAGVNEYKVYQPRFKAAAASFKRRVPLTK